MRIVKNYLYSLLNQVTSLIVPLATIPYVSRVLGPYGVGVNAYTNSIVSYFILLGTIGIASYGNRTISYLRDDSIEMSKTFWELVLLRLLLVAFSFSILIIFINTYGQYQKFLMIQSVLLIATIFDISWFFMGLEDFKKIAVRDFIVKIISLLCVFLLVKKPSDIDIYIYILTISQLLGNIWLWKYIKTAVVFIPLSFKSTVKHFKSSISFFIPQVAIQVYIILNKTMLGTIKGVHEVAMYENSYKLVQVILSLVAALGVISLPSLTNKFHNNQHDDMNSHFMNVINFTSFLSFPLSFGLFSISNDLSLLFFGDKFHGISRTIEILSPAIVVISFGIILGQYFIAINKVKYLTLSVLFGAVCSIFLNYFFIIRYGSSGAAIATVITELLVTLIQFYLIRKFLKVGVLRCFYRYGFPSLIMFLVLSLLFIDGGNIYNLFYKISFGAGVYIFMVIVFSPSYFFKIKDYFLRK